MVGSITARNRAISPGTLAPASTTSASASSGAARIVSGTRSEEHTSELQSRLHLVCRLLLEKKKSLQRIQVVGEGAEIVEHGVEDRHEAVAPHSRSRRGCAREIPKAPRRVIDQLVFVHGLAR